MTRCPVFAARFVVVEPTVSTYCYDCEGTRIRTGSREVSRQVGAQNRERIRGNCGRRATRSATSRPQVSDSRPQMGAVSLSGRMGC